jgi:imidazole glycerol-phosphate synthase subunit HisF
MTTSVRVVPCLDVDNGRVVKGAYFEDLKEVGDLVQLVAHYYQEGANELTFLDVTASSDYLRTMFDTVTRAADELFIPLTVRAWGGYIHRTTLTPCCGEDRTKSASTRQPSTILI